MAIIINNICHSMTCCLFLPSLLPSTLFKAEQARVSKSQNLAFMALCDLIQKYFQFYCFYSLIKVLSINWIIICSHKILTEYLPHSRLCDSKINKTQFLLSSSSSLAKKNICNWLLTVSKVQYLMCVKGTKGNANHFLAG